MSKMQSYSGAAFLNYNRLFFKALRETKYALFDRGSIPLWFIFINFNLKIIVWKLIVFFTRPPFPFLKYIKRIKNAMGTIVRLVIPKYRLDFSQRSRGSGLKKKRRYMIKITADFSWFYTY